MAGAMELIESLVLELRRGTVVLSVLSQLKEPKYGYALVQVLEEKGMKVDPGTLYPLLRRLEKQELLRSEWETGGAKPRKYYSMTMLGEKVYAGLMEQWEALVEGIRKLADGGQGND